MNDEQERYLFLLQPIKDLAKNWSVDIAAYLTDFIERLKIVHENRNTFTFAEAGMLIQGTAMVYGKKVEYIHQMALQLLDSLKGGNRKRKSDDDCQGDAVELEDGTISVTDEFQLMDFSKIKANKYHTFILKRPLKELNLLPKIPLSLMPLCEYEKTSLELFSHRNKKELIGKRDDFRINTGNVLKNGVLLLDLINEKLLEDFSPEEIMVEITTLMEELKEAVAAEVLTENPAVSARRSSDAIENSRNMETFMEVDQQVRGSSGILARDSSHIALDCHACVDSGDFSDGCEENVGDAADNIRQNFGSKRLIQESAKEVIDPDGNLLDFYEAEHYCHAPYKKAKKSVLSVTQMKCRKTKQVDDRNILEYLHHHLYGKPTRLANYDDNDFASCFVSIVLADFISKEKKKRSTFYRRENRFATAIVSPSATANADYGDYAIPPSDDESESELPNLDNAPDDTQEEENPFLLAANDEDLEQDYVMPVHIIEDKKASKKRPESMMNFDEMLKQFLRNYWTSGEEKMSQLSQRVEKWSDCIYHKLQEEEKRNEFDIHQYGSLLIDRVGVIGSEKSFPELLSSEMPFYEPSRYFLSMLMLANTGNVEIIASGSGDSDAAFSCKLLKLERHHEVFDGGANAL